MNERKNETEASKQASKQAESSSAEIAFKSQCTRCFYCQALLLITDSEARHAVCSENCDSRLVQCDSLQITLIQRAWRFRKDKELTDRAIAKEKEKEKEESEKEMEAVK